MTLLQPHIRNKEKRRKLANRFKDSKDPFRIVIVRDMWLTGFDAPCLHTMYADKPMQGLSMRRVSSVRDHGQDCPRYGSGATPWGCGEESAQP